VREFSFMDAEKFFNKKGSERGIADEPVVEPVEPEFSVEQILDVLGQYFDARLNVIEQKLDACLEK
jgi:hypothetical protein